VSIERFASVLASADGLRVSLCPEGALDDQAWPVQLGPQLSARRGFDGDRWVGVEEYQGRHRLVLQEQSSYIARVDAEPHRQVRAFGLVGSATPALAVAANTSVYRISTGNAVGLTRLVVGGSPGEAVPWSGMRVRIRVRKLGDPDRDFEWMVDDIVSAVRSLALTLVAPTNLGIARSARGKSFAYEDLIFLRSISRDVDRVMDRITRRPHYRVTTETRVEDASRAAEIDPGRLVHLAADSRALAVAPSAVQQSRVLSGGAAAVMTVAGRHWVPIRVPAISRTVDYDTFENRFVRFALEAFRERCHAIYLAALQARRGALAQEADALAIRFGSWLRRSPFDQVGTLHGFAMTSQVLLREDNYNALLRRYREFLLTSDIAWEGFDLVQESRDAAKLYEMWVFIQTVRAIASFAEPISGGSADALLRLDREGLVVNLRRGAKSEVQFRLGASRISVAYDRTYGGTDADPRPSSRAASYSLALRPDVSIEMTAARVRRRGFVDAKYRVDRLSASFADPTLTNDSDPAAEVEMGSFKVDDLNKMHAYRDAIGGARFAVAAYPGQETRRFPPDHREFATTGGVGAIALGPGEGRSRKGFRAEVQRLVEGQLEELAGSALARVD
jgi:predicted component of viral defense system (DUF524 family)